MRDHIRELVESALHAVDRTSEDGRGLTPLATEAIRLARLATSIHLAESTPLMAEPLVPYRVTPAAAATVPSTPGAGSTSSDRWTEEPAR